MVTRDTTWPEGTPCWVDLAVDDFAAAQRFYSELFGWEVDQGSEEFGGYAVCRKDGRSVAGLTPKMDPAQPTMWTTYLACDDVGATVQRVREAGGQVVADAMEVGDMGAMALFTDPAGAFVGLWQGRSHTGFQLANDPGSVTWNENYSRDWMRNREFYTAVFGCTYEEMPPEGGFAYASMSVGGAMVGGIAPIQPPMPEETPAHWNVYFKVEDADAALRHVTRLGGEVTSQPFDTEFGRMGMAADVLGGMFWVMADLA